jgi:hypothetical protein
MPDWVVRAAKGCMQWPVRSDEARNPAVEINCLRSSAELRSPHRVYWLDANAILGSLNTTQSTAFTERWEWITLFSACARGRTDPVAENQHTIVVGCVVGYIVQEQIGKGWPVLIGTGLTMGGVFLVLHSRFRRHAP